MARVNIYVPDDLKARMDAAGDNVNWSDIARRVFLEAVTNIEHRKERTMSTAIERLKASKERHVNQMSESGREHGTAWARDKAEYDQLARICDISVNDTDEWYPTTALKMAIDPVNDLNMNELAELLLGDSRATISPEFAEGFIEGAQAFYEEVEDDL